MGMEKDFDSIVSQIKAELSSVGRLDPGPKPRQGITVIISPNLTPGWIGISDDQGRQAFAPAGEILRMVQAYVRRVVEEGKPLSERSGSLWELMRDFPCDSGGAKSEE